MKSRDEVGEILGGADPAVRAAVFAALVRVAAGLASDALIVVGGSAVEIYTRAAYASDDLDIVGRRDALIPVLRAWGFQKSSRQLWSHSGWKIVVDLVKELDGYNGSRERTRLIATPYGSIRVEAVEDSIVRRLIQSKHWQVRGDFDWAVALAELEWASIDWSYAEAYAKAELVADLLAEVRKRVRAR